MTADALTFPVPCGMDGMNRLAQFLNAASLGGDWHFAAGTRFDQTNVAIDFDHPADLLPTLQRYRDAYPPAPAG